MSIRTLCAASTTTDGSSSSTSPSTAAAATAAVAPSSEKTYTLETLPFDNLALHSLPVDPQAENFVRQVPNSVFSRVKPEPVKNPVLVAASPSALTDLLSLAPSELQRTEDLASYFGGNQLLPGSETYASCYAGHQFGAFSGQLGDGAAISLGEVVNTEGKRFEVQLKGAGPTPYSRRADGRKVLRSSIREFLCSEAMHFLGVPTTRAAALVTSDSLTQRDVFYNGNVINERCSVVTRLAPSFLRFGSFEVVKPKDGYTGRAGPSSGNKELLRQLLDYTIQTYFPELGSLEDDKTQQYLAFYTEVIKSTAALVAHWQGIGFTHGVLNTDNMSVLGLTI
ncbi:hypothetical protein VYU27_008595, partial [Nannochloropsis oceanica]